MPTNVITHVKDKIAVEILAGGKAIKDTYMVTSIKVDEEVNRIGRAEIVLIDGEMDKGQFKFEISDTKTFDPGEEIEIKAGYYGKKKTSDTIFKGIVVEHGIRQQRGGRTTLVVKCKHEAVKMTVDRKTRFFEKKKDSEAFTSITGEYGLTVDIKATSYKHPKLVQYNSTDWDFILNRMDVTGGIAVANKEGLTIGPPKLTGSAKYDIYLSTVLDFDATISADGQIPDLSGQVWDMKKQAILKAKSKPPKEQKQGNLDGKKLSKVFGNKNIMMPTPAPLEKEEIQGWVDAALFKARMGRIKGSITIDGTPVGLGDLVEIKEGGKKFNGTVFVTRASHRLKSGRWQTTLGFGLSPEWFAEAYKHTTAPAAGGLLPAISGIHLGTVKAIHKDPDGESRIQVDIGYLDKDGQGIWARLAHPYASSGFGFHFIPELHDEVLVGFLNDDPRFPVILGSLQGSKIKPPYPEDKDNKIKAIVTKSKMKIEFEDKDKIITVETPGGNKIIISDKDKSIKIEDQNSNVITMDNKGISLESNKDISLKAKGKINLNATGKMTLESKADVALSGLNVKAAAKVNFEGKGAMTKVEASGINTIKGSLVKIN